MAEPKSEGGGSPALNLNSLLALVTLVGGVWLVSHRLTSDRPMTPAGGPQEFVGEQKVEARLWEDPFKTTDEDRGATNDFSETRLGSLIRQIRRRIDSTNRVLLLPVMLSSGQYSEDQESRIRSRFAIVSALGTSGYAPEDAEHIGRLTIPWPTRYEVEQAKRATNPVHGELWERGKQLGSTNSSSRLELRYEWYRPREFFPHAGPNGIRTNVLVLVLWVNDSYFEDEPLLRLPLLLEPLTNPNRLIQTNDPDKDLIIRSNIPAVALIGPRRSSTLRSMLQSNLVKTNASDDTRNLWGVARKTLSNISLYCATPSAMDEVLVPNPVETPRQTVGKTLVTIGFKSFHNFAATDAQLAREVFAELALGGIDLTDTNNHVVLISESDTFYARVLSLTYAAELTRLQTKSTHWTDTYDFVKDYKLGKKTLPTNLHSFVYLRGLDGQTVKREAGADGGGGDNTHATKPSLTSFEELRNWTPDANKAEGRAQFDYLSRLGGQLAELEKVLHRGHRGHIEAIGIIGSDVYDTLLILQALRPQFPDVEFFTTDLDARFLSPRERAWTRDLLVVSGYGLTLHRDWQKEVSPFRDSAQTAQFTATLAALGNSNLARIAFVPPRRFEIGMHSVVDLSVAKALLPMPIGQADKINSPWLHPLTPSETYEKDHKLTWNRFWWRLGLVLVIVLILAAVCWYWKPLRHLTVDGFRFPCQELNFSEEDVGGPDGAEALLKELRADLDPELPADRDPILKWIKEKLPERFRNPSLAGDSEPLAVQSGKPVSLQPARLSDFYYDHQLKKDREKEANAGQQKAKHEREEYLAKQAEEFVAFLNRILIEEDFPPKGDDVAAKLDPGFDSDWKQTCPQILSAIFPRAMKSMRERYWARRLLDSLLKELAARKSGTSIRRETFAVSALSAAVSARESTREIFRLRCQRLVWFWGGVVLFGLLGLSLGYSIWYDTFGHLEGEPFSLTSGASAWPAEILRLLVCAAAIGASFRLYRQMRQSFFELTRKFRLSFQSPDETESITGVCILKFWQTHRVEGGLPQRLNRIYRPLLLYVGVCVLVFCLFDQDAFDQVRGATAWWWNRCLIWGSGILFLVLAFLMMDSARLCREFILALNKGTTNYPEATRRHFARQRGDIDDDYLSDWIDLQLIVDLTERVGQLVYYPAILLFVLLLARNGWWDTLSWSAPLILVFAFNLLLALASVVILQRSAREAKSEAEESLAAKIKMLEASSAPSVEQNNAAQAKQLLDEIRNLRRGAFAPFWENPVVGALFLSSGGTTALQALIWFVHR